MTAVQVLHFEHCTNISLVCSLFQELTEWEIHFPTGDFCHRRCVKGTFFGTFFHARAERKYENERRRTAVVPSDDFYGITTAVLFVCESTD